MSVDDILSKRTRKFQQYLNLVFDMNKEINNACYPSMSHDSCMQVIQLMISQHAATCPFVRSLSSRSCLGPFLATLSSATTHRRLSLLLLLLVNLFLPLLLSGFFLFLLSLLPSSLLLPLLFYETQPR